MSRTIDIRRIKKDGESSLEKSKEGSRKVDSSFWTFLNKDFKLFANTVPDKIKESFYLELSTLLGAGMDIRSSLDLIKNEQAKKKNQQIFNSILQRIISGSSLSASLKYSNHFTAYEFFSIQIGEETGKLIIVLKELAVYYKKKINQKRQIISALTYPALVMIVAVGAVSFMMSYVVPMFADVLKRFGGDLPIITKMVLRTSVLVKKYSLTFFILTIGIVVLIISQKKKDWFRKLSSMIILRTPVVGEIIRKIYLSRFANTMSLLIGSKIPMLQAIQLVKKMVSFYPIESSLSKVEEDVMSGTPLHISLASHTIYTKKMISLIKVGEEVNQLDIFFNNISEQYSADVEHQASILSKFMEPFIIVILGLVVGVILIAMYLPLFKLGQTF